MKRRPKILFLNLTAFSQTGGIQKFNRSFLKGLLELEYEGDIYCNSHSLHDQETDENYFPTEKYTGFKNRRSQFVIRTILKARRFDYVVLGHINLSIVGLLISLFLPKKKIILITHGIEIWGKLSFVKKQVLHRSGKILAVSNFTKEMVEKNHDLSKNEVIIFPNTIDPYFPVPKQFIPRPYLREQYHLKNDDFVLFTLTRLADKERYKGYDIILRCLPQLLETYPNLKYVISGKYDDFEKKRLDKLIAELNLQEAVRFTGFIEDDQIVQHYQMSDLYIMPSRKEGFGIVFIEAMVCGLPVIAGNIDGSVDALKNGELGTLVNPEDRAAIIKAIENSIGQKSEYLSKTAYTVQRKTLEYFGFPKFRERLKNVLA